MAFFASYFKDQYFGTNVSAFTDAEIPDMSGHDPESSHWLANYVLNSGLRGRFDPPMRAYAYAFMRRAEGAFLEHHEARDATLAFLESENRQALSKYSRALLHWEFYLGQSWQAYELLRRAIEHASGARPDFFAKGDASTQQRLHFMWNAMKHVEGRIYDGEIIEGTVSPIWLENEGIVCTEAVVTFAETGDILEDIAKWANVLVDPRETQAKIRGQVPGR